MVGFRAKTIKIFLFEWYCLSAELKRATDPVMRDSEVSDYPGLVLVREEGLKKD